jgi:ATP-binding cassette, subfamily D (ALD), peroxisomal long-chain fatty acid import protein
LKFTRTEVDTSVDDINEIGAATTLFTGFDPEVRLQRHEEMISIDNSLKRSEDITKRLESLMRMKSSKGVRKPKMYIEDADGDDNED